ncbi:MAG: hypothetical protein ACRCXD_13575 [Luteolibacter sp.]
MAKKSCFRLFAWTLAGAAVSCGPLLAAPISVTDVKGRTIDIELVSLAENSVTFSRGGKEFILPLSNFDESSQAKIRENAAKIPAAMPKIQPDVIIGKRRQKEDSYYMVKQEITCTIKLANPSLKDAVPPLTGKILMIGQDRRTPDFLKVLSSQAVEASIKPGATFVQEMEAFTTSYDSDNKGIGNVGGAQYVGYVFVLLNEAGEVALEHTVTGSFRKALEDNRGLAKQLIEHRTGMILTEKLVPAPLAQGR